MLIFYLVLLDRKKSYIFINLSTPFRVLHFPVNKSLLLDAEIINQVKEDFYNLYISFFFIKSHVEMKHLISYVKSHNT